MKKRNEPLFNSDQYTVKYNVDANGLYLNDEYNCKGYTSPYFGVCHKSNNYNPIINITKDKRDEYYNKFTISERSKLPSEFIKGSINNGGFKSNISGKYDELTAALISQYIKCVDPDAYFQYLKDRYINEITIDTSYWKNIIGECYFEFEFQKVDRELYDPKDKQYHIHFQVRKLAEQRLKTLKEKLEKEKQDKENLEANTKRLKTRLEKLLGARLNISPKIISEKINIFDYTNPGNITLKYFTPSEEKKLSEMILSC
jgi:hypothetical protein